MTATGPRLAETNRRFLGGYSAAEFPAGIDFRPIFFITFLLISSSATGQLIDDWVTPHGVLNANDGNGGLIVATVDVQAGTTILGGERDIRVVRDSIGGQVSSEAFVEAGDNFGQLDHSQTSAGRGRTFIEWDGDDNDATEAGFQPTGLVTAGSGVDLVGACGGNEAAINFTANNSDNNSDIDVTVEVYTDASNWSTLTRTEDGSDALPSLLEFRENDFGVGAGTGADFQNVGAIRLIIETFADGADLTILSPAANCDTDLGDAVARNLFNALETVDSRIQADGPRHVVVGPRLGATIDAETDTVGPSSSIALGTALADEDDTTVSDDEDGVTFPAAGGSGFDAGDTFPVDVNVQNVGAETPLLCGWIDFSDIEQEAGFGFENDADERLCVAVSDPNLGIAGDTCDDTGTTGEFNCTLNFTIPVDWNGDNGDPGGTDDAFLSRFRITTDWTQVSDSDFNGFASDGEVEDYLISSDSLPVSIHSFESRYENGNLVVEWGTVSETRNAGFALWGDRGAGLELLTPSLIAGADGDPLQPRQYSRRVADVEPGTFERLFVTAVDVNGKERLYGDFEPGRAYGNTVAPAPIRWDRIRSAVQSRMLELDGRAPTGETAAAVDVTAAAAGMIEVTHEQLASAGLDLSDVPTSRIAVTLKGEPVARHVVGASTSAGGQPRFGPGTAIRFWADLPELPDALYVDQYSFRIADDPAKVMPADSLIGEFIGFVDSFEPPPPPGSAVVGSYTARQTREDDLAYHFASPLSDPWYTARLRAGGSDTHIASFDLDSATVTDQPATLRVRIAGLTDFPEAPDHRVLVELNGQILGEKVFEGQSVVALDLDVPAGLLQSGANSVRVVLPGGTAAPADIQLLDRIDLLHTRRLEAVDGRLIAERRLPAPNQALVASGFASGPVVAYARRDGKLLVMGAQRDASGKVVVPSLEQPADYWISSAVAIHSPTDVRGVPDADLLAGNPDSDFIVIAHPAFMPLFPDEAHPLNDFIDARETDGWSIGLFEISDIQRHYGWGMPLPEAVNRFLAAADASLAFDHVLLVGGDSYDYTDNLGLGSISFIPTHYRAARFIPHAPADPLLADLDGDGRPDKALGRWPVRSLDDLDSIVTKTLDWAGDPDALSNAVWVTDSQDPNQASFADQAAKLSDALVGNGWPGAAIARVHFDDVVPPAGVSTADAARAEFFAQLEQGRSLSGFVGHGSPAMWTFQGLLTPDDIGELYNEGFPTLIGTMTCYTTYFVSPTSDTVAHRWMNGYREDALGNANPGVANGSVAVHGAGVLSSYDNNGWFARTVLQHQLNGETLGRAIELTRAAVPSGGDALFNWILLGDPTLLLD